MRTRPNVWLRILRGLCFLLALGLLAEIVVHGKPGGLVDPFLETLFTGLLERRWILLGAAIPFLLVALGCVLYFYWTGARFSSRYGDLTPLSFSLWGIGFAIVCKWLHVSDLPVWAFPIVLFAIPLALQFPFRKTVKGAVLLAGIGAASGTESLFEPHLFILLLTAGVVSTLFGSTIREKSDIIPAGIAGGLSLGLATIGIAILRMEQNLFQGAAFLDVPWSDLLRTAGLCGVAGLASGIAIYHGLPVFEAAFRQTTDLTLSRYIDLNHPVLKEISLKAPGTYHHSLRVGDLGAAAAEELGYNHFLVRAAAHFHDIGKTLNAEYFIENQRNGQNPHDDLPPLESATVIINHVADGVRQLEKLGLPRPMIDITREHHGTSTVDYFLHKAREGEGKIDEAQFRYKGPRPQTPESAIIMIADGVEAITRSLKEPTREALGEAIDLIVKKRISTHQFEESGLNFTDLGVIRDVMLQKLQQIYHSRISYPEQEEGDGGGSETDAEARLKAGRGPT